MTSHEKVVDHESGGLALFYRQFRNAERLKALVRAWLTQVQAIEDALFDVLSVNLDTATGDALDQYGELLAFSRGALSNSAYRAVLRALIRARKSSATPEDIIEVATLALGGTAFTYGEGYGSVMIRPTQPIGYEAAALFFVLDLAKPGGVQLQLLEPLQSVGSLFQFSASLFASDISSSKGFADTTQSSGGHLAGVLG